MSRAQLEELGYTFVESDLPPIVREWCVGEAVLCATFSEFDYSNHESWKNLKPYPIDRVLAGYWIFGGLVVIEDSPVTNAYKVRASDSKTERQRLRGNAAALWEHSLSGLVLT